MPPLSALSARILELLKVKPGQKASELAREVGVDRRTVNSLLLGELRGRAVQDKNYCWWVANSNGPNSQRQNLPEVEEPQTECARLCRYYLDCNGPGAEEVESSSYEQPLVLPQLMHR